MTTATEERRPGKICIVYMTLEQHDRWTAFNERGVNELPGLELVLEHLKSEKSVWTGAPIHPAHLLDLLMKNVQAMIDNRRGISSQSPQEK